VIDNLPNAPPNSGKRYVRTFLFSMQLGAPLNQLHVITKFVAILILSVVLVRVMDQQRPDLLLAGVLLVLTLLSLYWGGVTRWLFRSYLVIIFPMFSFLLLTWIAFTPDPGTVTYLRWPLYSGEVTLGLSLAGAAFLLSVALTYALSRRLLPGLLLGIAAAVLLAQLTPNPGLRLGSYPFLAPYAFILSDRNLVIAVTKVLGYAAMVFSSLLLVMTTRDAGLIAALRQLRTPYLGRFFLAIVFRTLSLSLLDYEVIRQAQVARGINLRRAGLLGLLRNIARMSVPLVATMLRRASEIGDALQARGFALNRRDGDFVEIRRLGLLDVLVLIGLLALAVAVFGFSANLTHLVLGWA
jgi:energy-coupling factor transporter transmembrane protein EcfT